MASALGFVVEALVAVLLMVTIGYCLLVNRKLEQLRSDQSELRQIIRELNTATGQAEAAIVVLRESAKSAETTLREKVDDADALSGRLAAEVTKGEGLLAKLTLFTHAPRANAVPISPQPAPQAAPRTEVRASAIGLGLLNAQQRSAKGERQARGAA